MEQTRILLLEARDTDENLSLAFNILYLVASRNIPSNIEDVMYAYMVAKDWISWIKSPNSPDDVDNFMPGKKAEDYQPALEILEGYADDLEDILVTDETGIDEYLETLNPKLADLWNGVHRHQNIKEDTRMFFRTLRYMAQFFESVGDNHFSKLLDTKNVPPMGELNAKTNA